MNVTKNNNKESIYKKKQIVNTKKNDCCLRERSTRPFPNKFGHYEDSFYQWEYCEIESSCFSNKNPDVNKKKGKSSKISFLDHEIIRIKCIYNLKIDLFDESSLADLSTNEKSIQSCNSKLFIWKD